MTRATKKKKQPVVVNGVMHVDRKAANYRETHAIDKQRRHADGILRAVDSGGCIEMTTLVELLKLLGTKTDYRFHVAVEVLPTGSAILKTIDNERDAQETIRRLKLATLKEAS